MAFIKLDKTRLFNLSGDESHVTLVRVYTVAFITLFVSFAQVFNAAQLYVRDGGLYFDSIVSLIVGGLSLGICFMLRHVKSAPFYIVTIIVFLIGSILCVEGFDGIGINSALLPNFVMGTVLLALISGWRASLGFAICSILALIWLYMTSQATDPSILSSPEGYYDNNAQRLLQTMSTIIITFVLCAIYMSLITEKIRRLHKTEIRLKNIERSQTETLANISHELRTPMMGGFGLSDLLVQSDIPENEQHYAKVIYDSAESTAHMIDNIVTFSQLEMDMIVLGESRVNVKQVIEASTRCPQTT